MSESKKSKTFSIFFYYRLIVKKNLTKSVKRENEEYKKKIIWRTSNCEFAKIPKPKKHIIAVVLVIVVVKVVALVTIVVKVVVLIIVGAVVVVRYYDPP